MAARACPKRIRTSPGEQALVIRHALLRGFFLVLRDFRRRGTASEELQWERALDVNRVIAAIHFFQSTKSQRRVLPETSLRYVLPSP